MQNVSCLALVLIYHDLSQPTGLKIEETLR